MPIGIALPAAAQTRVEDEQKRNQPHRMSFPRKRESPDGGFDTIRALYAMNRGCGTVPRFPIAALRALSGMTGKETVILAKVGISYIRPSCSRLP